MSPPATGRLILLRHGESTANAAGIFTGILDAPLTDKGRAEAATAAALIHTVGLRPERLITSTLSRAIETGQLLAKALPTITGFGENWHLNERSYGALTGLSKHEVRDEFGDEQFLGWRRSVHVQPPPMSDELFHRLSQSPPFKLLPVEALPRTESLSDVIARVVPALDKVTLLLARKQQVVVVAHGNSLRAIRAVIDSLSEREIEDLNIPTGQPFLYPSDGDGRPIARHGNYLDPHTAAAASRRIALEGGT